MSEQWNATERVKAWRDILVWAMAFAALAWMSISWAACAMALNQHSHDRAMAGVCYSCGRSAPDGE